MGPTLELNADRWLNITLQAREVRPVQALPRLALPCCLICGTSVAEEGQETKDGDEADADKVQINK